MRKDIIEFDCKRHISSKSILDELDSIDDNFVLPSQKLSDINQAKSEKKKEKEEKKKKSFVDDDNISDILGGNTDDWIESVSEFTTPKIKKTSKPTFKGFGLDGKKKKKKKKNKENASHKKEFEMELALLKDMQNEHSKFVDSLMKKYNQMEETKSTARGIGKFTTDLITAITSARTASLQITKEIVAVKKAVADLDFRDKKEFGSGKDSEQQNLTNYASTYLKQVMDVGRNNVVGQQSGYDSFDDVEDDDDLLSSIQDSLGDDDRDEATKKFLQYENDNIDVQVIYHDSAPDDDLDKKYDFIAYNKDGDVVEDYPMPEKTKLNINRSTMMCSDIYGNKYHMEIHD